ncbi:hypothetical protein RFF05_06955 [Bengtsoniella intestinalis]|uniref:hypothetical protein n=1 Tax=Bengtsoniella intestinalis TaxID=3073143 RepID=UPI00391F012A
MTVSSIEQAWAKVNEIFPTDYRKDESISQRAGYPIYRSTVDGNSSDYICDLGARLEVNLSTGKSINIWIVETVETLQAKVDALQKEVAQLEAELEEAQGWRPYESEHNVKQADYEVLANSGATRTLTDDEAVELVASEFGFDPRRILIQHEVETEEINLRRKLRMTGTVKRDPLYCSTDWNYIRFDCGSWSYEIYNGMCRHFHH